LTSGARRIGKTASATIDRCPAECRARPKGNKHPADTDGGRDGFAHANLLAPQAIVTQRREIGVVYRPVDGVTYGTTAIGAANAKRAPSTSAQSGYCKALNIVPATTITRRPPPHGETDDNRANDKSRRQDQRQQTSTPGIGTPEFSR
jgi:hypothetical protein